MALYLVANYILEKSLPMSSTDIPMQFAFLVLVCTLVYLEHNRYTRTV
jgi:hypothetical protein